MKLDTQRRIVPVVGGLLMLALAGPVSAGSTQSFHFAAKGTGLEAFWTTNTGTTAPGTPYRDTYVNAATTIVRSDGATYASSGFFIDSFVYEFDAAGNFVPLEDDSAFVDGAALTASSKLTTGSVSASTTNGSICSIDASGNATCIPGSLSFSGSWLGQGALLHQHGTSSSGVAGSYQSTSHGTGTFRLAAASGSLAVNGSPAGLGTPAGADMFSFRNGENDVLICHPSC